MSSSLLSSLSVDDVSIGIFKSLCNVTVSAVLELLLFMLSTSTSVTVVCVESALIVVTLSGIVRVTLSTSCAPEGGEGEVVEYPICIAHVKSDVISVCVSTDLVAAGI